MTGVVLRAAVDADLPAIVDVFLDCWRVSYADILPPDVLARVDDRIAFELWEGALGRPGVITLAVQADDVLGVSRCTTDGAIGQLASLYVSPHGQGAGVGSRLLAASESAMAAAGARAATLWVFSSNAPSIAFYHARGWSPTGETRIEEAYGAEESGFGKAIG